MWSPAQNKNVHKGIRQQQMPLFMLYFGQCQILKREQRRRDKMSGAKRQSPFSRTQQLSCTFCATVSPLLIFPAEVRVTKALFFSCTHMNRNLFFPSGGQTLFIWCPLKYIHSATINLNLQHCDVKPHATAALSQPRGLRRTGILQIGCDFAHDWLHVCFLTANILQDCEAGLVPPPPWMFTIDCRSMGGSRSGLHFNLHKVELNYC